MRNDTKAAADASEPAFAAYPELRPMFDEFSYFREEILPSKYWIELNRKNLAQLADSGFESFKRSLARN